MYQRHSLPMEIKALNMQIPPAQSLSFVCPSASCETCVIVVTAGQKGLLLFFFSLRNNNDFALLLTQPHSFKPATLPNLGGGASERGTEGVPSVFPPSLHPQ